MGPPRAADPPEVNGHSDNDGGGVAVQAAPAVATMQPRHTFLFATLGLALGTSALANVWRSAAREWALPAWVNQVTDPLFGGLGCAALAWWVAGVAREEWAGRSCLSWSYALLESWWAMLSAGAMAVTSLAATAAVVDTGLSEPVWFTGVALQWLALAGAGAAACVGFVMRARQGRWLVVLDDFTPLLYPITVGLGIGGATHRAAVPDDDATPMRRLVTALFWVSFVSTAVLTLPTVALLARQLSRRAEAAAAVPLATVQMAPFGVCYGAWVSQGHDASADRTGGITLTLVAGVLASVLVVLPFAPHYARMRYAPTWAAMTFPTVSTANGVITYRSLPGHEGDTRRALDALGVAFLSAATAIVLLVWCRSVVFFACGAGAGAGGGSDDNDNDNDNDDDDDNGGTSRRMGKAVRRSVIVPSDMVINDTLQQPLRQQAI